MTDKKLTGRGGAGRGQGRKPGQTSRKPTKKYYINVRITEEERGKLKYLAKEEGLNTSDYVKLKCFGKK